MGVIGICFSSIYVLSKCRRQLKFYSMTMPLMCCSSSIELLIGDPIFLIHCRREQKRRRRRNEILDAAYQQSHVNDFLFLAALFFCMFPAEKDQQISISSCSVFLLLLSSLVKIGKGHSIQFFDFIDQTDGDDEGERRRRKRD